MNSADTTSADFFEAKYRSSADPWNFATDTYENARYAAIMRAIEGQRFTSAFEPGCSIGVLTRMLAGVADRVEACDHSATAVAAARKRCENIANVNIACCGLTADEAWPNFDLVVLSEIGYYFTPAAWQELVSCMCDGLKSGACIVACHWLGDSADHLQHGDDVHRTLAAHNALQHLSGERNSEASGAEHRYRLDLWRRH